MTERFLRTPALWTTAAKYFSGSSPMSGVSREIIGKTASADEYYGKAGSEFGEVITGLFE